MNLFLKTGLHGFYRAFAQIIFQASAADIAGHRTVGTDQQFCTGTAKGRAFDIRKDSIAQGCPRERQVCASVNTESVSFHVFMGGSSQDFATQSNDTTS